MLAVAEMGLSRIRRQPRPGALADGAQQSAQGAHEARRQAGACGSTPLLLTVNICQTVQATLTGIVAGSACSARPVSSIGVVLNVVVFFVLAESVPKTYAVI